MSYFKIMCVDQRVWMPQIDATGPHILGGKVTMILRGHIPGSGCQFEENADGKYFEWHAYFGLGRRERQTAEHKFFVDIHDAQERLLHLAHLDMYKIRNQLDALQVHIAAIRTGKVRIYEYMAERPSMRTLNCGS